MIIFSVLFALFINEWRSNVNENYRTETILNNLQLEIKTNHTVLKELLTYHDSVQKNIGRGFEQDSIEQVFFPEGKFSIYKIAPNGVIQDYINDIAWEVSKQENISARIDFDLSKSLFIVYEQQTAFKEAIYNISDLLADRSTHRKENLEETALLFHRGFRELVGREMRLIQVYEIALKALEKK